MKMTFDVDNPPPLTDEQKKRIIALREKADGKIDFTDIPPVTDEQFAKLVDNPFCRPKKVQVTMRMDSDVLAWLKRHGRGYQTRANNLLKMLMLQDMRKV